MRTHGWIGLAFVLVCAAPVWAENEGQADLDKAVELQVTAKTLGDLEKVANLSESALKKGLDKETAAFAKQLLASTLFQRATLVCKPILEAARPDPRWPVLRQLALGDLERAVQHVPTLGDAHLLIAKLHILPRGDRKRAQTALDDAVKAFGDKPQEQSKALVLRGQLAEGFDKQLADLDKAIQLDSQNGDAWQARAMLFFGRGDFDKAIADFNRLLADDADNLEARFALAEALANVKKYDEALEQVAKVIAKKPDLALSYTLRARIHALKDDVTAALADLDLALKHEPQDLTALMLRARMYLADGKTKSARGDVDRVLELRPGLSQGLLLRSALLAAEGDYVAAIRDLQSVLRSDPSNVEYRVQLSRYYVADKRPRKAVEVLNDVVKDDADNVLALRTRADALLSIGKHADAVADYEKAMKVEPDNSGVLNNLAWVLATSPEEKVRNARRSIELGTKACEVTKFKEAHILSTLAAGYAESGDFDAAIKWSTKAVEMGREQLKDQVEQLEKELDSYKQKKPWRELQQTEEKPEPVNPKSVLET